MRISDWSSDVCSSDLINTHLPTGTTPVVGTGLLDACAHSALSWRRSPFQQRNCPDLPRRHRPRLPNEPARTRDSGSHPRRAKPARQSHVQGKSVSVRVDLGGLRILKKKKKNTT